MPKRRQAMADALARLVFEKPLADLDRSERAELKVKGSRLHPAIHSTLSLTGRKAPASCSSPRA
jgi:hypothetical protein